MLCEIAPFLYFSLGQILVMIVISLGTKVVLGSFVRMWLVFAGVWRKC